MTFSAAWLWTVPALLAGLAAAYAVTACRQGRRLSAVLPGLALALPLGYLAGRLGNFCFFAGQQLSRWGLAAPVLPLADAFSVPAGAAGAAAGLALGARLTGEAPGQATDRFAPWGALMLAAVRGGEAFLGTLGAGPLLPPGHWAAGTVLAVANAWGEWHWAVWVPEAALAAACGVWALIRRREHCGRRLAAALCCGQMLLEVLRSRAFTWHFIRVDQLWCALFLAETAVRGTVKGKKRAPLGATILLAGLNACIQFALDQPRLLTGLLPEAARGFAELHFRGICYAGLLLTALGMGLAARQSLKGIYSPVRNMR